MKYKVGDKVKIISLNKALKYPETEKGSASRWVGSQTWESPEMDDLAGTTKTIAGIFHNHYYMKDDDWAWSEEMIAKLIKSKP